MGIGKTIQSLGLAHVYPENFPLLIICPSSLRFNWRNEIKKWFNKRDEDIQLILKSSTELNKNVDYYIFSYEIASKMIDKIIAAKFQLVILDEAHYIKNAGAKRTETLLPVIKQFKRVILLTGTPAFARPKELFNLLQALRPDIFTKFKDFGDRYCDPKASRWTGGRDYEGASHTRELHFILQNSVMIRRLKKDVLSELPPKRRQKVEVNTDPAVVSEIREILSKQSVDYVGAINTLMNQAFGPADDLENQMEEMKRGGQGDILKVYSLTGRAKIKGIKEYIREILENEAKFLIFAHHYEVLDGIEEEIKSQEVQYIRIDGKVPPKVRQDRVDLFQEHEEIRIAILSLTACSVGLNLTAASTVIFAEMNWTPAVMIQAEDRVHRMGQKEKISINCHYIYGEDTLDSLMFDKLEAKLAIVSDIIDGEESLNAERTYKATNDLLSSQTSETREIKNQTFNREAAFELTGIRKTPQRMPSIISYFRKDEAPSKILPRKNLEEIKENSTAEVHSNSLRETVIQRGTSDIFENDDLLDEFVETMLQESKKGTPAKSDVGALMTDSTERNIRPSSHLLDEDYRALKSPINNLVLTSPLNVDKSRSAQSTIEKKKNGGFLFCKEKPPINEQKLIFTTTAESSPAKISNQTAVNSIKNMLFDSEATKRPRPEQEQLKTSKPEQDSKQLWSKAEDDDFFGISKKVRGVNDKKF